MSPLGLPDTLGPLARDRRGLRVEGRIVKEGGPELVTVLEEKGYGWIRDEVAAAA